MEDLKELLISIKDLFKAFLDLVASVYALGISMLALFLVKSQINPVNWH